MQEFELSFALVSFVAPDVIEITPHREIEITQDMIRELQTKVLARTDTYVKLLINRKNLIPTLSGPYRLFGNWI